MLKTFIISITIITLSSLSAFAEDKDQIPQKELLRRIDILTEEINNLKNSTTSGNSTNADQSSKFSNNISLSGYGELLYQNYAKKNENNDDSNKIDNIDMLRTVFYVGYKFSERILLNSEIEIEHGSEIFVEQLYLDFLFIRSVNIRAGLLLAPMGFINETHEPPLFLGSIRPYTEQYIIPTTWREIGAGVYGSYKLLSYRLYALNGFEGKDYTGDNGLRGGRQKGIKAHAEDFALVGRIDLAPCACSLFGISGYYGNSGQDQEFKGTTSIFDAHAQFKAKGLQLRALYTIALVKDAEDINALDETGETSAGSQLRGWYIEAGYDIFRFLNFSQQLIVFGRYERLNTQYKTPDGFNADPANNRTIITAGVSYKPIMHIAIKGDYQWISNKADSGVNQFNIALGYMF